MSITKPDTPSDLSRPLPRRLSTFSTLDAPIEERVPLWEEQNREVLITLRVASYARESISSSMLNLPLESVKLTAIRGNDHVIERSDRLVKSNPADAIMFCLLNKGNAFFYGPQGVGSLVRSEAILYDTDQPFMYGFKSSMEQFIFEIPRPEFYRLTGQESLSEPIFFRNNDSAMLNVSRRIFGSAVRSARQGQNISIQRIEYAFTNAFRQLVNPASVDAENAYFMTAKEFIQSHAHLPHLSVKNVADEVGISERHLSRIFASQDSSVGRYISDVRLEFAYKLLIGEGSSEMSIGEIAQRAGFVHSSHFSRAFKGKYGMSPREARYAGEVAA